MFDLLFRHGHIIDGTSRPRMRADVAVQGDRIVSVGNLSDAAARETLDVSGKIICPGFIDVHNHSDGWLLNTPQLWPKTRHGFTTEVLMADGISYAPVNEFTATEWLFYLRGLNGLRVDEYRGWQTWSDYMELLDGANAQNSAAHLPYANIRSLVCGFGSAPVDDFQMKLIQY